MLSRFFVMLGMMAVAITASGQARNPSAKPYSPPRMPDGHPNLQGTYDLATLTPLERPAGTKGVLTREEAAKLEKAVAERTTAAGKAISAERQAPPKGGDGSTGAAGGVGGYNNFWLDPGSVYTVVNGEVRTSLVVDPPDGRVPPMTRAARQRLAERVVRTTSDATESRAPGLEPPGSYDNPEQ